MSVKYEAPDEPCGGQAMTDITAALDVRFYIMKNGDYCTHKPTSAKAVEAALVHCYFALDGDLVEVIDPAGEVAWSATVRTALDSYRAKVQR